MSFIDQFEDHYKYDCNYMRRMEKGAGEAFQAFTNFLPMGRIGASVPNDILWTAKISGMLVEDCGACTQLSIRMAVEAGVKPNFVRKLIEDNESLEAKYKLIFDFARAVVGNTADHIDLQKRVEKEYTEEQLIELSVALASVKVYPTIKRALGAFESCSLYEFEF